MVEHQPSKLQTQIVTPDNQTTCDSTDPDPTYSPDSSTTTAVDDGDFAIVVELWPELSDAVRAGILAMVKASSERRS